MKSILEGIVHTFSSTNNLNWIRMWKCASEKFLIEHFGFTVLILRKGTETAVKVVDSGQYDRPCKLKSLHYLNTHNDFCTHVQGMTRYFSATLGQMDVAKVDAASLHQNRRDHNAAFSH